MPSSDKSFLLHWILVQLRQFIPGIRNAAQRNGSGPIENFGFYVYLGSSPPATFTAHDLSKSPKAYQRNIDGPSYRFFRNLVRKRVSKGDKNATLLTIMCNSDPGRIRSCKRVIVDLDKSHPPIVREPELGHYFQDEHGYCLESTPGFMDVIYARIRRTSLVLDKNVWSPGLIERCVDEYIKSH